MVSHCLSIAATQRENQNKQNRNGRRNRHYKKDKRNPKR